MNLEEQGSIPMMPASDEPSQTNLPKSSRFSNETMLPDLRTFQAMNDSKPVLFNGQASNINYNPFNMPQSKSKSNFPISHLNVPSKISVVNEQCENTTPIREIPTHEVTEEEAKDPIQVIESLREQGKQYGAIKLIIPESIKSRLRSTYQINSDLFCFQTNRILNNSNDELNNRLEFHRRLYEFHMSQMSLEKSSNENAELNDPKENVGNNGTPNKEPKANEHLIKQEHTVITEKPSPNVISNTAGTNEQSSPFPPQQLAIDLPISSETNNHTIKGENIDSKDNSLTEKNNRDDVLSQLENRHDEILNIRDGEAREETKPDPMEVNVTTNDVLRQQQLKESNLNPQSLPVSQPETEPKMKVPSFLNKLPMIDKRPLDLYKLFRSVLLRGGFLEVINKKLWAQIGRELGYKGKIMTSLSSSLKSSYQKILFPFELFLGDKKFQLAGIRNAFNDLAPSDLSDFETSNQTNENGKREIVEFNSESASLYPLLVGSGKDFKRSLKAKSSKGILLNSLHLIDVKPPLTFSTKQDDETKKRNKRSHEVFQSPITPELQINAALKAMLANQNHYLDDTRLKKNGKFASIYSLRHFMEKDLKFQEFLINHNKQYFDMSQQSSSGNYFAYVEQGLPSSQRSTIDLKNYEKLYWASLRHDNVTGLFDGLEVENGVSVPSFINGSGFARIGDDIMNFKQNGHALNPSNIRNSSLSPNASISGSMDSSYFNSPDYIHKINEIALNPWNLHNFPTLPNSFLGALSDNDINNKELTSSRINIGMTFSTENWSCEDHFTQLCNYQFFGAPKRWYFIPELEFDKFEDLIRDINIKHRERVNINNQDFNIQELISYFKDNDIEYDALLNSLENMVNVFPEIRLKHVIPDFQKLIDKASNDIIMNQEFMITPEMLQERGINFTSTVQNPGELIVKYPKTYSCNISFGLSLNEEANIATKCWLDYAAESEDWLSKQTIVANFSHKRLIINLIQLYDSGKNIGFDSDAYAKIKVLFDRFLEQELELRREVRKLIRIKELVLDEKSSNEHDFLSDDELKYAFPSKIVMTDSNSQKTFILTLESFLRNYKQQTLSFDKYKIEMHSAYSDDKLKNFSRILQGYSINFDSWMKNYEKLMKENTELPLKTYKSILSEGERISSAISTSNFLKRDDSAEDFDKIKLNTFKCCIKNLKSFINDSNQFIEDCQTLLAIKHQQRIRNGTDFQRANGLGMLIKLLKQIPSLNFSCTETEQILEFKVEIENFDKACRNLLAKKSKSMWELENLIDLGESFGIEIPALTFITRLRDREAWIESLKRIEKGEDPLSENETFSIENLSAFFQRGMDVLGEGDIDLIKKAETILNDSEKFDIVVGEFLNFDSVNNIDLDVFNKLVVSFRDNTFFLNHQNYKALLKLQANEELIRWIRSFRDDKTVYSYTFAKGKETAILESGLPFEMSVISEELQSAEKWTNESLKKLKSIKLITTVFKPITKDKLNAKLTLNESLIEESFRILDKWSFSFSSNDLYELSSSYVARHSIQEEPKHKVYCFCREPEYETMIECDKCNEWYHLHCLNDGEFPQPSLSEDASYACPVCKLLESGETTDEWLTSLLSLQVLKDLVYEAEAMKIHPENDLEMVKELLERSEKSVTAFTQMITETLNDVLIYRDVKLDKLRFAFRKLYGSSLTDTGLVNSFITTIHQIERERAASLPKSPRETTHPDVTTSSPTIPCSIPLNENSIGVLDASSKVEASPAEASPAEASPKKVEVSPTKVSPKLQVPKLEALVLAAPSELEPSIERTIDNGSIPAPETYPEQDVKIMDTPVTPSLNDADPTSNPDRRKLQNDIGEESQPVE